MHAGFHGHDLTALPEPFPPTRIWILGAGKFGAIAAKRLQQRFPSARFLVVDSDVAKLGRISDDLGLTVHVEDAVSFFNGADAPDDLWMVPAVPVHVVYEWMFSELGKIGRVEKTSVPHAVDAQVPNPYRVVSGTLYTSFATFICPDACNEPDGVCTFTKEPRPGNLFEVLNGIRLPEHSVVVVRSWQLAPGVGGVTMRTLREKLAELKAAPGLHLVATSCRCHGVIDGLEWQPP